MPTRRLPQPLRHAIAKDYAAGFPCEEIARRHGVSEKMPSAIAREYGIPQRNKTARVRVHIKRINEPILPPRHDTRDFTGRHLGDPYPERSALAKRGA